MRLIEASRPDLTTKKSFPLTEEGMPDSTKHALHEAHAKRMAERGEPQSGIIPPAKDSERTNALTTASKLLTKEEPFTHTDAFAFADAIHTAAGTLDLGDGEYITVVPDLIPRTGHAEITIHTKIDAKGPSVNVVFQDVDAHEKGDKDREMPKQTRFVLGENFGRGSNRTTVREFPIGNPHPYTTRSEAPGEALDIENDGRKIFTEIYVAYQTAEGRLDPSQAEVVIEELHKGTPIRELQATSK